MVRSACWTYSGLGANLHRAFFVMVCLLHGANPVLATSPPDIVLCSCLLLLSRDHFESQHKCRCAYRALSDVASIRFRDLHFAKIASLGLVYCLTGSSLSQLCRDFLAVKFLLFRASVPSHFGKRNQARLTSD